MRETEAIANARREVEICNACRYCEGFCAVFPALELRREFSAGDLSYLANLCHNCRGCYYACQYAPPHEWGINIPRTMAEVRAESYEQYAWPAGAARAFEKNGTLIGLAVAVSIALVLILSMAISAPAAFFTARPVEPGAFYSVIPLWAMQIVGDRVIRLRAGRIVDGRDEFLARRGTRGQHRDQGTRHRGVGCADVEEPGRWRERLQR